jgi:hypothetical protein
MEYEYSLFRHAGAAGDRTFLLLIGIFTLQYVANW